MGKRGPAPKRSSERRRRNRNPNPQKAKATGKVSPPPVDRTWHPIAKDWYRSLKESGQSQFFEPSDWQAARYVAEVMTRGLASGEVPTAQLMRVIWSAMTDLLTTEGARRRIALEIEREGDGEKGKPPAGVTALEDYRRKLKA